MQQQHVVVFEFLSCYITRFPGELRGQVGIRNLRLQRHLLRPYNSFSLICNTPCSHWAEQCVSRADRTTQLHQYSLVPQAFPPSSFCRKGWELDGQERSGNKAIYCASSLVPRHPAFTRPQWTTDTYFTYLDGNDPIAQN